MSLNSLNRKQISDATAFEFYESAQRMKRETGKSVADLMLETIYDLDTPALARVQAIRVFFEVVSTFLDDEQAQELIELSDVDSLKETH